MPSSLRYELFSPSEPIGALILIIGVLFTSLTFLVFFNVSRDIDSMADTRRKQLLIKEQNQKIAKLYPKKIVDKSDY